MGARGGTEDALHPTAGTEGTLSTGGRTTEATHNGASGTEAQLAPRR